MRKFSVILFLAFLSFMLYNCSSAKRASASQKAAKTTYTGHLSEIIAANCAPCHIPEKGGNKKAFDNYTNVKTDIDEMIRRIELEPTVRGFMPFKKTEKLPAEVIAAFKQWKTDGMLEN